MKQRRNAIIVRAFSKTEESIKISPLSPEARRVESSFETATTHHSPRLFWCPPLMIHHNKRKKILAYTTLDDSSRRITFSVPQRSCSAKILNHNRGVH